MARIEASGPAAVTLLPATARVVSGGSGKLSGVVPCFDKPATIGKERGMEETS